MATVNETDFNGKWKLCDSENFEGFLEKMGANWMIRKLAVKSKPECTIECKNGDDWTIATKTGFFTRESAFKIGEEFVSEGMSAKLKSIASWKDGKLAITSNPLEGHKGFKEIATRELTEDGRLLLTMDVDPEGEQVICKRWFKKEA